MKLLGFKSINPSQRLQLINDGSLQNLVSVKNNSHISADFKQNNKADKSTDINAAKCLSDTSLVMANNVYPIIINANGNYAKWVDANYSFYPSWARQALSYETHIAFVEELRKNKTYKSAFRENKFAIVPVSGLVYSDDTGKYLLHKRDNSTFYMPAIYEFNNSFDPQPIYSFAVLNRISRHFNDVCPNFIYVDDEDADLFLVANWKHINRYLSDFDDTLFSLTPLIS